MDGNPLEWTGPLMMPRRELEPCVPNQGHARLPTDLHAVRHGNPARSPRHGAISVLLPVRNAAATLPAALDSLLAQTLEDFEVICVDG